MATQVPVYLAIIGVGGVGRHFLDQLPIILRRFPNVRVALISRSNKTLYAPEKYSSISLQTWEKGLAACTQTAFRLDETLKYLKTLPGKSILIDNTSSQEVANTYPLFLQEGISIVTPNKKAFSSSLQLWRDICTTAREGDSLIYHESSVGAGLPVISTLKDLIETGDTVYKIEGVFSGTMSFLFNNFAPVEGEGGKWSDEVKKAKEAGYTEPDPRDDLNGVDVARKLVILARIVGLEVAGVGAFPVESLIPRELESVGSGEEFLEMLEGFDGRMEAVKREAGAEGKVVRFVGCIDVRRKEVKVGLENFEKSDAIAGLKRSDNLVSFYTERYGSQPLVVQGAGAGGAVTAMGVTADLIKVLQRSAQNVTETAQ